MKNFRLAFLICTISLVFSSCNQNKTEKKNLSSIDIQFDSLMSLYNIPAIAYGVIKNDSILLQKATGYRDIELKTKAQLNDLFHIGSNTKAVTSFVAAKLVEQGKIAWDTKFFDLYPELKTGSNSSYENINLKELLSHRARLIPFKNKSELYPIVDYEKELDSDLDLPEKRYYFIKQVLKYDPIPLYEHSDDRYSNAGYIAASLMLERVTGKNWEGLISEMSDELSLGFQIGWPDDHNPDQPKGHINPKDWMIDIDKDLIPLPNALKKYHYFNQYILICSPSGHLSISLPGFLEFLRLNINGINGMDNYLKSKTYNDLFSIYPDYSCGWMNEKYFIPGFHHKGSAGTFNSIAIIVPEKELGIVIMMNVANGEAIDRFAELLINQYGS